MMLSTINAVTRYQQSYLVKRFTKLTNEDTIPKRALTFARSTRAPRAPLACGSVWRRCAAPVQEDHTDHNLVLQPWLCDSTSVKPLLASKGNRMSTQFSSRRLARLGAFTLIELLV